MEKQSRRHKHIFRSHVERSRAPAGTALPFPLWVSRERPAGVCEPQSSQYGNVERGFWFQLVGGARPNLAEHQPHHISEPLGSL